jgi:toxin ParE1/3/4
MARALIWSAEAEADLQGIAAHIAARSPENARRVIDRFRDVFEALVDFPYAHRVVPEFGDPARRETFVHEYRLMYRVEDDAITVLRVVHGRRLLKNVPGSFDETAQADYTAA